MPLQRQGLITVWADTDIDAGMEWEKEIEKHLETAHIILLLISPDFMASEYCYSKEMKRAVERHERGEVRVIPVILRPIIWRDAPFGKLQALPTQAIPVTSSKWYNLDEAFLDVAEAIGKVSRKLSTSTSNDLSVTPVKPVKQEGLSSANQSENFNLGNKREGNKMLLLKKRIPLALGVLVTVVAVVIVAVLVAPILLRKLTPLSSTPTRTIKPTVTSTSLLYQADWSKGMDGWRGGSEWSVKNGMLVNNGNNQIIDDANKISILAPFQPQTANYAVEAQIQFLGQVSSSSRGTVFGIFVHGGSHLDEIGYDCYFDNRDNSARIKLASDTEPRRQQVIPHPLGTTLHTYRVVAKNNVISFFMDNMSMPLVEVTDNTFMLPGMVGLMDINSQIKVSSFTVSSL